jgi:uncharacterized protein YcbX
VRVVALHVYPVKGCHAVALDEARLDPLGLAHDRRFAFVGGDGRALTQREHPLLATIHPRPDRKALHLDFGGLAQIECALDAFGERIIVDVWGKRIAARAVPVALTAAAADYLGAHLRLVALDPEADRSFADSRPVLVASNAMLAGLGVEMERFRPNIVVDSAGDGVTLKGEEVLLEREKPCGRCEVTTIDQQSGERRGPEPLRTLNERFDGNFGVYYRVTRPGRMRRGETLQAV